MRPPPGSPAAGMTMTEVMAMALIISTLMIILTESMSTLSGVRLEQKAHFRVGDVGDSVGRRIESDLDYAARVFSDTADDLEYLRSTAIGGQLLAAGRRLPRLTQSGYFRVDPPQVAETGNIVFLVRRGPKVRLQLDSSTARLVQGLQFVVYCPVVDAGRIELIRWLSEPLVDYWGIADIEDPTLRAEAIEQLQEGGVHLALDAHAPRGNGLFELVHSGLQPLAADRLVAGVEDRRNSRPFTLRRTQIAPNDAVPGMAVPAYAQAGSGFSGGFEVKLDGSASGKLVLLRFVVVATEPLQRPVATEIRRCISTGG